MRLIASGDRPSCFAAFSSVVEDLASSMSRRSSLNDQGLRAISAMILLYDVPRQSRQTGPCSPDGFAWVGSGLGKPDAEMDKSFREHRNKQRILS